MWLFARQGETEKDSLSPISACAQKRQTQNRGAQGTNDNGPGFFAVETTTLCS